MKKIMILAASAALILTASCAKNEVFNQQDDVQHIVGFTDYVPRSITKADGTYASAGTLINGKEFAVYSYATANGTAFATNALGTKFMDRVAVTYTTGGNADATKNTYSPVRYWPSGDNPQWLTFWAYYPVGSTSGKANNPTNGINYTEPNGSNNLGSFAFTAASSANSMVDFMVANVVNDKIYGTSAGAHIALNGVVPLTFKHQLAKIGFVFKTDLDPAQDAYTKVVLTDAKLYNVRTQGTLSATYTAGETSTTWNNSATLVDSNTDGVGDVVYEITIDGSDISNQVLTLTPVGEGDGDLFLMIPQEMDGEGVDAHKVVLTWYVKTFDSVDNATNYGATETTVGTNGLLAITTNSATVLLDNVTVKDSLSETVSNDWAKNQFTTYNITIGPKPIQFTATVTTWDDKTTGAISVN